VQKHQFWGMHEWELTSKSLEIILSRN